MLFNLISTRSLDRAYALPSLVSACVYALWYTLPHAGSSARGRGDSCLLLPWPTWSIRAGVREGDSVAHHDSALTVGTGLAYTCKRGSSP
jgi:hypothetical protein